jgi:hypothetical protein
MIKIDDENVVIPRKTWEKYKEDDYFRELIEIMQDTEEIIYEIETSNEFYDLRDYDRKRRSKNLSNRDK